MSYIYEGSELALFAGAHNWKRYLARQLSRWIGRRVLDVGAGLGSNISYLSRSDIEEWLCLEPDDSMAKQIVGRIAAAELPSYCRVLSTTVIGLPPGPTFDTILYLDVLEHIKDDSDELQRAARLLSPGGKLLVLSPAYQFLFSPFDAAIGHFRRYTPASLRQLTPAGCREVQCRMLDSIGFFASLANRFILKADMPSQDQINVWDKGLVRLSRIIDPFLGYRVGKSILCVWEKENR